MHENARATLNTQVFPGVYTAVDRRLRLVTANNVVHFLRESHWPATIQTGIGIGRIGRTSYVASTGLFTADGCAPIPEEARTQLAALLFAESGPISMGV